MQRNFLSLFALLILWLGSIMVQAAEIDSFTPRKVMLTNAADAINRLISDRLVEGVRKANLIDQANQLNSPNYDASCNEEILYTELRKALFQSFTASWGFKGYSLDKQLREELSDYSYHLSLNDSVYRDLNYLEAFSLNLKELSDVVRIDGHLVGLDKIGHFFAEGWQYFEMNVMEEKTLYEVMRWGREQEEGKFGYVTTGVFSYADLTANFNGWRFWNRVLLNQKDPVKGMIGNWLTRPHVSCSLQWFESIEQKRQVAVWVFNDNFDIEDYVDGAWDEGQNCNSYADPIIEDKIRTRLHELGRQYSCPGDNAMCRDVRKKYGAFSKRLLHPRCLIEADGLL